MQSVNVVRLRMTFRTHLARLRLAGTSELRGYYSGRYGDDPVSEYHDDRREEFPEAGFRRKITVPDSRHRYDRPVDARGNINKPMFLAFDDVHQRANNGYDRQDRDEEDKDLLAACRECRRYYPGFGCILRELEYTEDPHQPQDPDRQKVLRAW